MNIYCFFLLLCLYLVISCGHTVARKPVTVSSTNSINESISRNKLILRREMAYFDQIIKTDSLTGFKVSSSGFLYRYISQHKDKDSVVTGDRVKVSYDVRHPDGKIIYSKAQNGIQSFVFNKEANLFPAMRDAISMMREKDTLQAFFPSSLAYGYHGDENNIKTNAPLFCEVILLDIDKNNNNQNPMK